MFDAVLTGGNGFGVAEAGVGGVVVFVEGAEREAVLEQAADDFGQAVVPAGGGGVEGGRGVGIGAAFGFDDGTAVEVAVGDAFEVVVEHPQHGVEFYKYKAAVGF